MENCGADTLYSMFTEKNATEAEAKFFMKQAVRGLEALHKAGIFQQDVKITNMVVKGNSLLKLIDFGLSSEKTTPQYSIHGANGYYSREMYLQLGYIPEKTDIWNIGVCTYRILYGEFPFGSEVRLADAEQLRVQEKTERHRLPVPRVRGAEPRTRRLPQTDFQEARRQALGE